MNPKELRIGNFLTVSNNVLAISEIKKDCFRCQQYINEWEFLLNDDDIHPIPITEEWLKRFGLKIDTAMDRGSIFGFAVVFTCHYFKDSKSPIWIEQYSEGEFSLPHIKYVHQLQNLYFSLTNEELELIK
jgi:hypothetical protein